MDPERERIQDDLRGLLRGDVRCDDLFLQLYASDASIYEIRPLGVVRPRHTDDVVACVKYAAENRIPLHARGAGTGLAGESLGPGIVVDFSRYMHRIGAVTDESVQVQPGVVHAHLNQLLAKNKRVFGPDPAMSAVTTMGSVLAIDASGSHWLRYGSTRHCVQSLQVVLADGSLIDLAKESLNRIEDPQPRRRELVNAIAPILQRDAELIEKSQPKTRVNRCGYGLVDVLKNDQLDMARLLVGSEGTLGLITEATLSIVPMAEKCGVVLLLFDRLDNAARSVMDVLKESPSACDLLDRRHLGLARENDVRFDLLIPPETEALLLVEFDGDSRVNIREKLQATVDRVHRNKRSLIGSRIATDPEDVEVYWELARKVVPTLYRLKGTSRPLPFIEDVAVAPEILPEFLTKLFGVLKRHQVTASIFGHAGQGQLHVRPLLNLADRRDVEGMERITQEVYHEVLKFDGTISGEHGDGLSRTQFIKQQYGPLYNTFRDIKHIFDPEDILNPGKIVSSQETLIRNLRPVGTVPIDHSADSAGAQPQSSPATFQLQLSWDAEEIAHAARNCNGCGACRSQLPETRMCPIFRLAPSEEASPRAKANLLRGVLTGRLDAETIASEEFKKVADLCVNCHQCRLECPASVDIPKLMTEAKAAHLAVTGMRPTDWLLSHLDWMGAIGCRLHRIANWSIGNRWFRFFLEKTLNIAQGRKLPQFARQNFLRQAARRRLTRADRGSGLKALYFVDVYANYFDTALAEATVDVLEHNGISVYVHPGQMQSAMSMITIGAVDVAKKIAKYNVALLAERVRQGFHVICSEPATATCLIHEYPNMLGSEDASLVAENTMEIGTYLWKMHQAGEMRLDLKPLNAVLAYHQPCHMLALGVGSPGENLLKLIPGITVNRVEKGCSGMAGTYGLRRENYRSSLRAGFDLIATIREPKFHAATTECSTCKMQMEQGTTKPTIHPVKLLAWAYGLTPATENPMTVRSQDLIVS